PRFSTCPWTRTACESWPQRSSSGAAPEERSRTGGSRYRGTSVGASLRCWKGWGSSSNELGAEMNRCPWAKTGLSAGSEQEYVEDCPVCCCPHVIYVEVDEDGGKSEFRHCHPHLVRPGTP